MQSTMLGEFNVQDGIAMTCGRMGGQWIRRLWDLTLTETTTRRPGPTRRKVGSVTEMDNDTRFWLCSHG